MKKIILVLFAAVVVLSLLMANLLKAPVEYLIDADYQLYEVKIWGQQREVICKGKNILEFFEYLLKHENFGKAPGLPGESEMRSSLYYIKFGVSERKDIRLTIRFMECGTLFTLLDGAAFMLGDPDYYWFKIPEERPADFERLLDFLLYDETRGESLEI